MQIEAPSAPSAIVEASRWFETLLTGTVGVTIATIAVAFAGMAMLQGRSAPKHAVRIIMGCFILFGAPSIAQGISNAVHGNGTSVQSAPAVSLPPVLPSAAPQFDPYAGASTPR